MRWSEAATVKRRLGRHGSQLRGRARESATRPTRGVGVPVSASGGAWLERLTVVKMDTLAPHAELELGSTTRAGAGERHRDRSGEAEEVARATAAAATR